jgi:hypothetical protein
LANEAVAAFAAAKLDDQVAKVKPWLENHRTAR